VDSQNADEPYLLQVTLFRTLADMLPFMRFRRAQEAVVDAEAISLIRSAADDEAAYQTARQVMRAARERGDRESARLYARVAVRIADVTGRQIGSDRDVGGRYQDPTRVIEGERTKLK
jgi:hypothetical protein